jgi:GNAT superfamily N-acetyltransferase
MSDAVYRPLHESELPEAVEVYLTAKSDMIIRQGQTPAEITPELKAADLAAYDHLYRTGIFHVAEVDGRLGAVACAIVRDDIWFLSGFWVRPDLQRKGLGGPLLRRVHQEGVEAGARTFCVWASSDVTAQASYLKLGMLPGYPVYKFSGPATGLPEAQTGYRTEPLNPAIATGIDKVVRGTAREADHRYWLANGFEGMQVLAGARPVGYFYAREGRVGASAWLEPASSDALLTLALQHAATQSETVSMTVPGANPAALRFALKAGLQLGGFSHFLTTAPFGRPEQYVPSGPYLY